MFIFLLNRDQLENRKVLEQKKMDSYAFELMGVVSQLIGGEDVQNKHDRLRMKIERCMLNISKIDDRLSKLSAVNRREST